MQPRLRTLAAVLVTVCAWICAPAGLHPTATARAQIAFALCGDSNNFACGHLTVPLDPTGQEGPGVTPGTLTLALRRHRAPVGEARSAIIALAGGPGQPALPFAEQFAETFGSIAATRDLITFDQRGIGLSQPLSCHAFERPGLFHSIGKLIQACASQLGPQRAFYTTADSVADIEAIRQAGGYEKLVLYGTSYGTKVAEQYAQDYPTHVEALVLDSVVTPNGPDPLSRSTFAAVPRILRQVCAAEACAQITREPVGDLARVLRRMRRAPLKGRAIDGDGRAHTVSMTSDELIELLLAGDFAPILRAEFVTAVSAAANGDDAALARLLTTAARAGEDEGEDFDTPLYYATSCEEQDFPWSRAADPGRRIAEATAAAGALPAREFAPFSAADALGVSDVPACAYWPFTTPAPTADDAPLPNVPTLILSGEEDLRTPTANARELAAEIPDAQLLLVPYTGHSVLSSEPTACASDALRALFAGHQIRACKATSPPASLRPPPLPPVRVAMLSPIGGDRGLPGRTLHAVTLSIADFARQLALALATASSLESLSELPALRSGGLRAGWAEYANGALTFHGYSYVPGVTVSGRITSSAVDLQIGGSAAAHGTLGLGSHMTLVGSLDGRQVQLAANPDATAAIVGVDAQARPLYGSGGPAVRRAARGLAGILGRSLEP